MNGSNFDLLIGAIALLLPITAGLLVSQKNPYYALVIRGILGAIAALLYSLFGAADVALTEALVGTMLSITLYAVAVRSSMSMRLGVLSTNEKNLDLTEQLNPTLEKVLSKYHLRLEIIVYEDLKSLREALEFRDVHCILQEINQDIDPNKFTIFKTRIPRLYEIFKSSTLPELVELQLQEIQPSTAVVIPPQYPSKSTLTEN
jgi:putative multicomponent Na+:H+ antiporter subunit B